MIHTIHTIILSKDCTNIIIPLVQVGNKSSDRELLEWYAIKAFPPFLFNDYIVST